MNYPLLAIIYPEWTYISDYKNKIIQIFDRYLLRGLLNTFIGHYETDP